MSILICIDYIIYNTQWSAIATATDVGQDGTDGRDGTGRDRTGRDGTGRDGRDRTGRDGTTIRTAREWVSEAD